ncbi:hypothetical protein Ahy_B10g100854 [Arachis hypogaea]|uniref:PGG domain-containing protein n=1 Tax=Arachis hypogaea TaxID=3818 RepID=A0A444WXR6_ARAHY|nr:hypothetical protein Ahy_B10g100854 [Arachis hypogaea]
MVRGLPQRKYRDHCGRLLLPALFVLCNPLEAVKIERVDLVAVTAAKPIPWSMSYWRKALPDEETLLLASCNYETNTKWGQEIGFLYGTVCEDVHTGFMLNCNGRNSVFCDPAKPQWFVQRVRRIIPPHYLMHCDKDGLTANDVLEMEHQDMHKEAKCWIKETAQSCSTIAVLVAAVVFAAAYTIPGGSENGTPVFFDSRVFLFFTITDVVALVSSLASVVMFLSILT